MAIFSEIAFYAGVPATDWSWGALLFDMDNDGWKDIFVSNGIYKDFTNQDYVDFLSNEDNMRRLAEAKKFDYEEFVKKMNSTPISNYAFLNNKNFTFSNKAKEFGLDKPSFSNGAAYGDLDNDGDNDLVINNVNMPLSVYKNNAEKLNHHYLRLQLEGDSLNKFGIGSTVKIFLKDQSLVYYHQPDHGFQSSGSPNSIAAGIGDNTMIDSVQVIWPDGYYSLYKNLTADSLYIFQYSKGKDKYDFSKKVYTPLVEDITKQLFDSIPVHKEDGFIDYNRERLMLQTAATENPYMAAGDINNDGLTDFYFGNAKDQPAKIYIQFDNGRFREYIPEDFKPRAAVENAGAVFGDFDKDGDQDLIVTCGGNENGQNAPNLYPAYYENDGTGHLKIDNGKFFQIQSRKFLPAAINASVIEANDFDKDGDLDLFIGGRSVPGIYGSSPPSLVFANDGHGRFDDITLKVIGNNTLGMITAACWADIDKNGFDDLIITGNWMGILIFKNQNGVFTKDTSLENYKGWWSSLKVADVDGDGNMDIIGGNLGTNSKFRASFNEPMRIYIKDFDDNGTRECIMSVFKSDHKQYVFNQRRDLAEQMPSFKKRFLKYADYAGKEFETIFPASDMKDAEMHEINFLESGVFFNNGNMKFSFKSFSFNAQLSSVNSILFEDLNHDGKKEVILTGNFTDFKPEAGTLDANTGQVYIYNAGNFNYLPSEQTGLKLSGQVRSSLVIRNKRGDPYFIFGRNNAPLMVFKLK
ncbi:MAG: FG-GAP-like repeat-containing protein [Chitinophagaceae bacterium]